MRARVASDPPLGPLSTLETVEMETSASAATSARVARVAGSPDVISADMNSAYLGGRRGLADSALSLRTCDGVWVELEVPRGSPLLLSKRGTCWPLQTRTGRTGIP